MWSAILHEGRVYRHYQGYCLGGYDFFISDNILFSFRAIETLIFFYFTNSINKFLTLVCLFYLKY